MRLNRWKKYAPHLIILVTLIAVAIPTLGSYALNELSPYLALSEETAKPEAIVADRMEIVDRTYVDDDPAKGWETATWVFKLQVNNRGDTDMILPAANITLNYLDETLGNGWISEKYEIPAGKSKMVDLYMVMENKKITKTWFTALLHGEPLDLTAIFEPYILIDDPNGEPLLGLNMVQELEFSFPHASRGPPPFIHSITRSPIKANQPVSVSVSATDEGTGISNRTYIYYSINNGITWTQIVMTGGDWWNKYKYHINEIGMAEGVLEGRYPIRSTLQEETYEGKIPGFISGTNVLFKVYLEDYAGNYEHEKTANWVESQTYSYIVPGAGEIQEFTQKFTKITEPSSTDKFFDYIELNGINLMNYLWLHGVNNYKLMTTDKLAEISDFFYLNDIDASYCMGMLNIDTDKAYDIMADSGISAGYLLELFGMEFDEVLDYLVEHIFLPTKHNLAQQASDILEEMVIIDDMEPLGWPPNPYLWKSNASEDLTELDEIGSYNTINNIGEDRVGYYRLLWRPINSSTVGRNFNSNPIDLSKYDYLTFMLDYQVAHYKRLNGNLSVTLIDNNGRKMTSKQITFENDGSGLSQTCPDQQITLRLNSGDFTIDPGFNFGAIHQVNFTYSGTLPVKVWFDYISAYSSKAYSIHQYFTYDLKLTRKQIYRFLFGWIADGEIIQPGTFWSINTNTAKGALRTDYIITDWDINKKQLGDWNFLNLVATDNGIISLELGELGELGELNHHMTAANLILENRDLVMHGDPENYDDIDYPIGLGERSAINFYEKFCSLLGTEIDEFDEEPIMEDEIYPYTQSVGMMMVYVPLGAIAALAVVLQVRKYRYKTKVKKTMKKYKKIGKR